MSVYKKNQTVYIYFRIVSGGVPVSGLVNGDFSKYIYKDGSIPGSPPTITVSEISNGFYSASFIPDSTGFWFASVWRTSPLEIGFSENFKVTDNDIDDMSIPVGSTVTTVTVENQDSDPVEDVVLEVFDNTLTTSLGILKTDSNGKAVFGLAPDTYKISPRKKMHSFSASPYTIVVSGATSTLTIACVENFVRSPASQIGCTIWGYIVSAAGKKVPNAEVWVLPQDITVTSSNDGITKEKIRTQTNRQGYFQIELIQGQIVVIEVPEMNFSKKFTVPSVSEKELFTIT